MILRENSGSGQRIWQLAERPGPSQHPVADCGAATDPQRFGRPLVRQLGEVSQLHEPGRVGVVALQPAQRLVQRDEVVGTGLGGGESENRNKEFQCDLAMDRLSDHRFVANSFRLYLHAAAMNLLVRLRRFVAEPFPADGPADKAVPGTSQAGAGASPAIEACVPAEALAGAERQRHFRLRRQRDPLGEGQPCTWRTLLIKVAAEVVVSTRRIVVRLSSSWPHLGWYHRVCERLRAPVPAPVPDPSG
jgi:hypothetical protein